MTRKVLRELPALLVLLLQQSDAMRAEESHAGLLIMDLGS